MLELAALGIALTIVAILASLLAGAQGWATARGQPIFGDYIAFWSAGRATLEGHVAEIHERAAMLAYHQQGAPGIRFYAPWNSPPTFLLVVTPFALLPYAPSALLFLAATGALYVAVARKLLPDARALLFAATAPAAVYHLGTVQVGLLLAGVTGLALHWLDRRPHASGALIGLLAVKPHLALVWPLMLALSGRWRAFIAAAVAGLSFVILAGLVFGFDAYLRFLDNLSASAQLISAQRITTPSYASLYANLLQWRLAQPVAISAHVLSAVCACGLAVWRFRRGGLPEQGAALCALTLLISPYLFFYDSILLAVGAALLGAPRTRFEMLAAVFAWGAGLSLPIGHFLHPFPLIPLASWLLLAAALRRAGTAAAPPPPAPQP